MHRKMADESKIETNKQWTRQEHVTEISTIKRVTLKESFLSNSGKVFITMKLITQQKKTTKKK